MRRRLKPALTLPALLVLALTVLLLFWGGSEIVRVADDVIALILSVYATGCAALAARAANGRLRLAWLLMATALAAWAMGDLIWLLLDLVVGDRPFPSSADLFYLGFTVLAAPAMALFGFDPRGGSRLRIVLEGITVALCLLLLAWIVALEKVFDAYRDDRVGLVMSLAYPVADVVAFSVALTVFVRTSKALRGTVSLLVLALAVTTFTDLTFAYTVATNAEADVSLLDASWALAQLLFAAAAICDRQQPAQLSENLPIPSRASTWMPYVPLMLAGTVGPALTMTGVARVVVPCIVVSVCLRQSVAAREHRKLLVSAVEQAFRDPLTGLANRRLFADRLAHALAINSRDRRTVAVMSLDLNDFKMINDNLGHPAADGLLVAVGRRMTDCVRSGDTVARVGGDEFAVLVEGDGTHAHLMTQRVLAAFDEPFRISGQHILVRSSIGLSLAGPDVRAIDPETLLRQADVAMYTAKRSGSSRVCTFDPSTMAVDPAASDAAEAEHRRSIDQGALRVRLLGELRTAVAAGDLDVAYQPKVSLSSGQVVGVEALLRWPHPDLGLLGPATFMSLIRQHGLMYPVTDWVIARTLADAASWASGGHSVPVAVNLFAPSLHDTSLPETLRTGLDRYGLPAETLTVEITEDVVLMDLTTVTHVLDRVRAHGIRVAIDDFGSGFSALSYLRALPIDEVKLDRHFISSVTSDRRAAAIARSVIELTHDLGMVVVAEGVESPEQADWLRAHGCDVGQGFYFARPVAADAVLDLATAAVPHR